MPDIREYFPQLLTMVVYPGFYPCNTCQQHSVTSNVKINNFVFLDDRWLYKYQLLDSLNRVNVYVLVIAYKIPTSLIFNKHK